MEVFVSLKDARGSAIAEWVRENEVAIKIIQHHDIIITSAGRYDKFSSLICVDLASRGYNCSVTHVRGHLIASGMRICINWTR